MGTEFYRPSTKAEALELLCKYGKDILVVNGGTDAVLAVVEQKAAPKAIMHISSLPGFHEIKEEGGFLHIGGCATFNEILACSAAAKYQGLVEAINRLASPSIRVVGTAAGNICTAAPAADCAAMLYSLNAQVVLESTKGTRTVALKDFYVTTSSYTTVREADELVTEILVPSLQKNEGTGYFRLSRRKSQDIAKVIIGARVTVEAGKVTAATIGLGALNATLVHAAEMEQKLVGMTTQQAFDYAMQTFPAEAKLHKSYYTEYKKDVVSAAVARALEKAMNNAEGKN